MMLILSVLTLLFLFLCLKISLCAFLFAFLIEESFFDFDTFLWLIVTVCHSFVLNFFVKDVDMKVEAFLIFLNLLEILCLAVELFNWVWFAFVKIWINVCMFSFSFFLNNVISFQSFLNDDDCESFFCFFAALFKHDNYFCRFWIFSFNLFMWIS